MNELVSGYTDGIVESLGRDVARVAGELEGFVGLLSTSGDLRAVLDNSFLPVAVRRTVLHDLLERRVSPATLQLLSFAVQSGADAHYGADVGGVAAAAAARRDGLVRLDEGPLGRTAATERVLGYAAAVLAPVKERQLGNIEDDLFRFMRIVEGNDQLREALTAPGLSDQARRAIVTDLLGRRASAEANRLAAYAAYTGRPRDYLLLLDGLVRRVAAEANRRVADVKSASELDQAARARLAAALTRVAGYPVEVRVTMQPDLLGGFVAAVGDLVVDASLRHRLERAREALTAAAPPPGASSSANTTPPAP
ncbi:MAG TPA: F0F1 ATP synthase subunit delta [Acidimicrobiales bacterium]|nr:F0F1 ATP synthase subunit delta [Acidimicrobiales bacterium]